MILAHSFSKEFGARKLISLAPLSQSVEDRIKNTETFRTLSHNLLRSGALTSTVFVHNMKLFTCGNLHRILVFAVLRQFASVI